MKNFRHNIWQIIICIDQLLYCILALLLGKKGWADCTLSAAAHYWHIKGVRTWPEKIINKLFWFDKKTIITTKYEADGLMEKVVHTIGHCEISFEVEKNRRHLPPELRL